MGQKTGSKLGKECIKAVYCHPTYLIYMQSASWDAWLDEAQAGIKIAKEISITLEIQMIPPYGRKWRGTKEPLDESERGEQKKKA